jgi:hypothetical protein
MRITTLSSLGLWTFNCRKKVFLNLIKCIFRLMICSKSIKIKQITKKSSIWDRFKSWSKSFKSQSCSWTWSFTISEAQQRECSKGWCRPSRCLRKKWTKLFKTLRKHSIRRFWKLKHLKKSRIWDHQMIITAESYRRLHLIHPEASRSIMKSLIQTNKRGVGEAIYCLKILHKLKNRTKCNQYSQKKLIHETSFQTS